tara:strand:- start:40 stop:297 length:258 start_codon:yes stop_codon:yes gene_type:complete
LLLGYIIIVCEGDTMNETTLRRYVRNILKEYYLMEKSKLKLSTPKMPKIKGKMKSGKKLANDLKRHEEQLRKEEEVKKELGVSFI